MKFSISFVSFVCSSNNFSFVNSERFAFFSSSDDSMISSKLLFDDFAKQLEVE